MNKLYNIKLSKGKEVVYDENLSFRSIDNMNEDITSFIKLIRPTTIYDKIEYSFMYDLNENGTRKK